MKKNYLEVRKLVVTFSMVVALTIGSLFTQAQTNIAPLATATASYVSATLGPNRLNDLSFGTCGSQECWISTGTPPSTVPGTDWIQFDWNQTVQFDEMIIHHGQITGRFMNGFTLQVWNGGSWQTVAQISNLTLQCVNSVTLPRIRAQRIRMTAFTVDPIGQQSNINFTEIEIIEAPEYHNEAGIAGLTNPSTPVCAALSDTIDVVVGNYAIKPMDSVLVDWTLNGVPMDSIQFKTRLLPSQTGNLRIISPTVLSFGDTLKIWTSMPNGINDSLTDNDTLTYILVDGLSGTYTVGGSSADFSTIDSAIMKVNRHGICDNVTFMLNDGSHVPTVYLKEFYRSNPNGVLTFTSTSNDRSLAFITDTSTGNANNFTLNFDRAGGITFKELTISNGSPGTYSGVIRFLDGSNKISFEDCDIYNNYNGSSQNGVLISGQSGNISDINISSCNLTNGSFAVLFEGDPMGVSHDGLDINESKFQDQTVSAIDLSYTNNIEIIDNEISSNSPLSGSTAIQSMVSEGDFEIAYNKILGSANWPLVGIEITEAAGTQSNIHLMYNNIISLGDTSSTNDFIGLSLNTSYFWSIIHNTMVVNGKSVDSRVIEVVDGTANDIYNNIAANFGSGTTVEYDGNGSVFNSDGNCLYTMGTTFAKNLGSSSFDLQSWLSNTGFDKISSVSDDPLFYDRFAGNFKLCSPVLDDAGVKVNLSVDYEGNGRNVESPDPGAFEYSSPAAYSVADQAICLGDSAKISVVTAINDIIIWNGTDTSNSWGSDVAGMYTSEIIGECGNSTDTFMVVINDYVELKNDTNICAGLTYNLSANVSNAQYMWNTGATGQSISVNSPGQYYVEVIDSSGCNSIDTIEVTYSRAVELRGDVTICADTNVELDPGTPGGTYMWSNGSTASKLFVDSSSVYWVEYTDKFNCTSRDTTRVTVNPLPFASFTQSKFSQSNWEFIADDTTGVSYEWSFGDGKIDTGRIWKTVNIYDTNGVYTVTLTVHSNSCGSANSTKEIPVETVSVSEVAVNRNINIYPNPTTGIINISYDESTFNSSNINVRIIDLQGKTVLQEPLNPINGLTSLNLEDNDINPGLYHILITEEKELIHIGKINLH